MPIQLWNLNSIILNEIKKNHEKDSSNEINKITNKYVKNITENLENFRYNKIIANLHEVYSFFSSEIKKNYTKQTLLDNYKKLLIVMSPAIPHFASECLSLINSKNISWPSFDEKILQEDTIKIVVQINGKKRGLIETNKDITEENLLIIIHEDEKLEKYLQQSKIKKKIYIKNKLINLII